MRVNFRSWLASPTLTIISSVSPPPVIQRREREREKEKKTQGYTTLLQNRETINNKSLVATPRAGLDDDHDLLLTFVKSPSSFSMLCSALLPQFGSEFSFKSFVQHKPKRSCFQVHIENHLTTTLRKKKKKVYFSSSRSFALTLTNKTAGKKDSKDSRVRS